MTMPLLETSVRPPSPALSVAVLEESYKTKSIQYKKLHHCISSWVMSIQGGMAMALYMSEVDVERSDTSILFINS